MLDRRSEARLMCAEMVGIQWKDDAGNKRKCTGLLEDISVCGACLQLDDPIELGTPLEITYRKGHLEGSVTYCFFREIGYWVGVQFAPTGKWSLREYRPKHLLDLKKMLTTAPGTSVRKPPSQ